MATTLTTPWGRKPLRIVTTDWVRSRESKTKPRAMTDDDLEESLSLQTMTVAEIAAETGFKEATVRRRLATTKLDIVSFTLNGLAEPIYYKLKVSA